MEFVTVTNFLTLTALVIGGGGLATLAGVITAYRLNRRKQDQNHKIAETTIKVETHKWEVTRRDDRILKLEEDNDQLVQDKIELSRLLGESKGEVIGLKSITAWLAESNRTQYAKQTAAVVADKVVEAAMARAVPVIESQVAEAVVKAAEKANP